MVQRSEHQRIGPFLTALVMQSDMIRVSPIVDGFDTAWQKVAGHGKIVQLVRGSATCAVLYIMVL